VHGWNQGRRHGFKGGGGDNFASGGSEKIFLTPPPYDYLGGTEINMVDIMTSKYKTEHVNLTSCYGAILK